MDDKWQQLIDLVDQAGGHLAAYRVLAESMPEVEAFRIMTRHAALKSAEFLTNMDPDTIQRETVRLWLGGDWLEPEWTAEQLCELVRLAHIHPEAFWVARREAANRHLNGKPMPRILVEFSMSVLYGDFPAPKPQGRPVAADDYKLAMLYKCTKGLIKPPHIHRFRNESAEHRDTACDYMAEALAQFGWHLDPGYLNELCKKAQYKPIRILADRLKPM